MGKEVKIGLAVIGVLLCVFGGVLFFRLRREAPGATPRKVAAVKKEETKAEEKKKKEAVRPDKQGNDRPKRFGGKTAWSTPAKADSEGDGGEDNRMQAPALKRSPYRSSSAGAGAGRYGETFPAESSSIEPGGEDTHEEAAGEENEQPSALLMPNDRAAQGRGRAFARDTFAPGASSEEAVPEDEGAQPSDAEDNDVALEPREERTARELTMNADRYPRGEKRIESTLDPSEPAEAEGEAVQLSPLVEDESEVRPAADERYAKRRFQQDQTDGDRLERDQLSGDRLVGDRFNRDQFDRDQSDRDDRETPREQEMVDDTGPVAGEPVEEGTVQRTSDTGSYVVEPNDNFWRISQKVYGTGAYFKALEEHNRRQQGERRLINVGDVLAVPPLAELRENYPDLCPKPRNVPAGRETLLTSSVRGPRGGRTYTVAEGDTLFDIARQELGKASRWAEIYQLNREQLGDDFNYLSPGMQLVMPERDGQTDPIASRPRRDGYRR